MKNLKQFIKSISIAVVLSAVLISCGGGGKDIEAVKLIPVKSGQEFQYVDVEGKIVINPQFGEASIFRDGLALVQTTGEKPQWGYIGEDGKYAIAANYVRATVFGDGLAWVVSENGAPTCINAKGEIKFALQNAEEVNIFHDGLAAFKEITEEGEEKWGFVDKEGKVKINAQFSSVGNFVNGKCPVSNPEGKWGFIDQDGKILINYQFDYANSFYNGYAVVSSSGKAGLIDESGKYKINPQFSELQSDGDLFLVEQDGKYGWTDQDGKIVINPQFSAAFPFTNSNLAAVQSGKSYGYIDKEGKIVINPQFDMALPFNGKLALVVSSGKIGFIDSEGKYVINPQFDDVAQDLVDYYQTGGSAYSSVTTDFFNVGAITSRLKFDAPEGLSFNSTFSEILTKFTKTSNDFSKYSAEHLVLSNEKITNDASVNFYVFGSPWVSDGWWDYIFTPTSNISGFAYEINLSLKGYGKEDVVKKAIEASLAGYSKDESSTESVSVFKNATQTVTLVTKSGSVTVIVKPIG
jgi:hypothetical protein